MKSVVKITSIVTLTSQGCNNGNVIIVTTSLYLGHTVLLFVRALTSRSLTSLSVCQTRVTHALHTRYTRVTLPSREPKDNFSLTKTLPQCLSTKSRQNRRESGITNPKQSRPRVQFSLAARSTMSEDDARNPIRVNYEGSRETSF